jgi:carboxypeptidase C (cathepsin A)
MTEITKRSLIAAGGLALMASRAAAQEDAPLTGAPFVTKHSGVFGGKPVDYVATVGETVVPGPAPQPGVRYVCTWYVAAGGDPARRPVLFAFNGGPSSSSATLHMVALGPKRIAIAQDPKAAEPPPSYADNPNCPLDVCDIVFIDPPETGFTRVLPGGKREAYYSVNGDAQSVADFVIAWSKANGREASPKYVVGESYGTMRAAVMSGLLAKTMPLDGVFLFGQAVNMIETSQRNRNVLAYATNITALAAIAAYHGKARTSLTSPAAIADAAYAWGMGAYLQALLRGNDLPAAGQKRIAAKLQDMTGIGADYYLAHDLTITKVAYARELLKAEGMILGTYDARYVGPAPRPGERPVDPAGKLQAPIEPMMLAHYAKDLGVTFPAAEYRSFAPGANRWEWNGTLGPGGPFFDYDYQAHISDAFHANPRFRLMIGSGYYDLTTTIGPARYMVTKSDWPRDRVFQRQYVGGHMAYTDAGSHKAFTNDIRAFATGGRPI